jgi:uncharacterized protein
MPRKFFRKYLPTHESVRENKWISRFGRFLQHPNLWHLNRRSVAGGVAIGLFAGLVPGPLQMLTAAILAIPLRVNLPVALVMTLYTNPITIVPLYFVAFQIGQFVTGTEDQMVPPPEWSFAQLGASIQAMSAWIMSLGWPLFIGLVTLAASLAVIGYCLVQIAWRVYVIVAWRHRTRRRQKMGTDHD